MLPLFFDFHESGHIDVVSFNALLYTFILSFLIIPLLRFLEFFILNLVLDGNQGFLSTFKQGVSLSVNNNFFKIIGLEILFWLIAALGFLLLGIGLFLTIPLAFSFKFACYELTVKETEPLNETDEIIQHLI